MHHNRRLHISVHIRCTPLCRRSTHAEQVVVGLEEAAALQLSPRQCNDVESGRSQLAFSTWVRKPPSFPKRDFVKNSS